jgi:hypothetical protein
MNITVYKVNVFGKNNAAGTLQMNLLRFYAASFI